MVVNVGMQKIELYGLLLCLSIPLFLGCILPTHNTFAIGENKTLMQPQVKQDMKSSTTNIILVHGAWADGSSWDKVIPILKNSGHNIIAVQLPLSSLQEDINTVERAINQIGGPVILVAHSYGGYVITNAAYNNPNVTGLVYIAAFAPDEGEKGTDFVDIKKLPPGLLNVDSGGFVYINQTQFHDAFVQDIDPSQASIMAITQKPINESIFVSPSGPPAWKQLPTWFQISENDRIIPPKFEHQFAERMNATTISLNSSHASLVSHPNEVAQLILDAVKGATK